MRESTRRKITSVSIVSTPFLWTMIFLFVAGGHMIPTRRTRYDLWSWAIYTSQDLCIRSI